MVTPNVVFPPDFQERQLHNSMGLPALQCRLEWHLSRRCHQVGAHNFLSHSFTAPVDSRESATVSLDFVMVAERRSSPPVHEMAAGAAGDISRANVTGDGMRLACR